MTESKTSSRVDFKDVVKTWWKFFWRYAVLLVAMLVANGLIINQLSKAFDYPSLFYWGGMGISFLLHLLVSFLIFNSILGKQVGKSGLIIVPTVVRQRTPDNQQPEVSFPRTALTWWNYFWRFALFAFAIAFTLGALLPIVGEYFGYNPYKLLKYSKYIGNISVIPASLLVFMLLMWRKEKRRKLDLIKLPIQ
jgi:hypothetical protein